MRFSRPRRAPADAPACPQRTTRSPRSSPSSRKRSTPTTSCTSSSSTSGASSSRCAPLSPTMRLRLLERRADERRARAGKERRVADLQQPPAASDRLEVADRRALERKGGHHLRRIDRVRPLSLLLDAPSTERELTSRRAQVRERRRRAQHGHDPARHAAARASCADTALLGQVRLSLSLGRPEALLRRLDPSSVHAP